jgi:mannose-6-phosphate isomerase-like protein (cupin superfamily)
LLLMLRTGLPAVGQAQGLVLKESEGERRVRRPRPARPGALGAFIIKVDEKNGGSKDLWMGYEDIPPGRGIPPHHHPYSGEILFIQRGTGMASLGSRQAAVGPGATIYIPENTRVSLRNTGAEPLTLAFIFAHPGIGEYFRETSVLEGDSAKPISEEELGAIRARHREHITFDSLAGANGAGLILQADEGEQRMQRPPPRGVAALASPFLIKLDRKNGGSPDLVMLYRDVEPGKAIAPHHHPSMGEILFVQRGSGVASLGSREAPVTAGTTIYIPPNTSAALRNTGTVPLTTVAIFPRPGFEDYLRDVSVAAGQPAPPLTAEELSAIRARHREHVIFEKP